MFDGNGLYEKEMSNLENGLLIEMVICTDQSRLMWNIKGMSKLLVGDEIRFHSWVEFVEKN